MKDNQAYEEFIKGIWRDNPVFVQVLGMCPMLAVTNSAVNAVAMGGATLFVLVGSSLLVSSLKRWIPKQIRISCYIIIIATFVTVADFSLQALIPEVHKELGAFIPLIVANCMILGRQEAFASKNNPFRAIVDAVGMGVGFTLTLTMLGAVRELLDAWFETLQVYLADSERLVADIRERQPAQAVSLLVVGQDKPRRFQRLARRLGVADRVRFLGFRRDAHALLAHADLLVIVGSSGATNLPVRMAGLAGAYGVPVIDVNPDQDDFTALIRTPRW